MPPSTKIVLGMIFGSIEMGYIVYGKNNRAVLLFFQALLL
jgi:hypothetical protein